jgi:hypothetical protein
LDVVVETCTAPRCDCHGDADEREEVHGSQIAPDEPGTMASPTSVLVTTALPHAFARPTKNRLPERL